MGKVSKVIGIIVCAAIIVFGVAYITPGGRSAINTYFFGVQKADDSTNYETRKKVEDTCRSMISSYEADKLTYEQYKDSDSKEKQGWAEQAKMRANKTANSYNEYILKNNFVWSENIPSDIRSELEIVE